MTARLMAGGVLAATTLALAAFPGTANAAEPTIAEAAAQAEAAAWAAEDPDVRAVADAVRTDQWDGLDAVARLADLSDVCLHRLGRVVIARGAATCTVDASSTAFAVGTSTATAARNGSAVAIDVSTAAAEGCNRDDSTPETCEIRSPQRTIAVALNGSDAAADFGAAVTAIDDSAASTTGSFRSAGGTATALAIDQSEVRNGRASIALHRSSAFSTYEDIARAMNDSTARISRDGFAEARDGSIASAADGGHAEAARSATATAIASDPDTYALALDGGRSHAYSAGGRAVAVDHGTATSRGADAVAWGRNSTALAFENSTVNATRGGYARGLVDGRATASGPGSYADADVPFCEAYALDGQVVRCSGPK